MCPGPIDTDSFRYYAGEVHPYAAQWLAQTRRPAPTRRRPEVAEVDGLPVLAPAAPRSTDRPIVVDGGLSLATMPGSASVRADDGCTRPSAVAQTVVQLMSQVQRRPARCGRDAAALLYFDDRGPHGVVGRLANAFVGMGLDRAPGSPTWRRIISSTSCWSSRCSRPCAGQGAAQPQVRAE